MRTFHTKSRIPVAQGWTGARPLAPSVGVSSIRQACRTLASRSWMMQSTAGRYPTASILDPSYHECIDTESIQNQSAGVGCALFHVMVLWKFRYALWSSMRHPWTCPASHQLHLATDEHVWWVLWRTWYPVNKEHPNVPNINYMLASYQ